VQTAASPRWSTALLVGLIAVVIVFSVSLLGKNLLSLFEQQRAPAPSERFAC